jgi:hypothetical protein
MVTDSRCAFPKSINDFRQVSMPCRCVTPIVASCEQFLLSALLAYIKANHSGSCDLSLWHLLCSRHSCTAPWRLFLAALKAMLGSEDGHLFSPHPCFRDDHTRRRQRDYLQCTTISTELVCDQPRYLDMVLDTWPKHWFGGGHTISLPSGVVSQLRLCIADSRGVIHQFHFRTHHFCFNWGIMSRPSLMSLSS